MPVQTRPSDDPTDAALRRHWRWRPDWTRERRLWWWYLTFEADAEVQRLARDARATLRPLAPVHVIPPRWLHLTLAEVGPVDSVPARLVDECGRQARAAVADLGTLDLHIGRPGTLPGAVVLPVAGDGLVDLHGRLLTAIEEALPEPPAQRRFDPHISIAYVDRDCRRADVLDDRVVERCRPGRSKVDRVRLVEVTRDHRHYSWTTRSESPLAAGPIRLGDRSRSRPRPSPN